MPTDALNSSVTRRQRRIERRCIAPVVAALRAGQISPRSADVFLRLTSAEQQAELTRRLSEAHEREARNRTVASVIKLYLDRSNGQHVDLVELSQIIKKALAA
jgi:hypothetical protein